MLEPYTYFNFGAGWKLVVDCNKNLAYFDSSTKTWNCPTDLTFMPVWLTTDGFKIAVDTNSHLLLKPGTKSILITIYGVHAQAHRLLDTMTRLVLLVFIFK
jgi:hypothetical protein